LSEDKDGNGKDWKNRTDGKKEAAGSLADSMANYLENKYKDKKKKDTNQGQ
jgi:hypothetical protein